MNYLLILMIAFTSNSFFGSQLSHGGDSSGGGDYYELEAFSCLREIVENTIPYLNDIKKISDINVMELEYTLNNLSIVNIKPADLKNDGVGEDFFSINVADLGISRTVYARNSFYPTQAIFLNSTLWEKMGKGCSEEKNKMLIHEIFGASGIEVNDYIKGNAFFDLYKNRKSLNKPFWKKDILSAVEYYKKVAKVDVNMRKVDVIETINLSNLKEIREVSKIIIEKKKSIKSLDDEIEKRVTLFYESMEASKEADLIYKRRMTYLRCVLNMIDENNRRAELARMANRNVDIDNNELKILLKSCKH